MRKCCWLAALTASIGCSGFAVGCGTEVAPPSPADEAAEVAAPHGDHSPHHGGIVMMKDDLHYEVVFDASGRYRLYFTDAARTELPASAAARASLTIVRPQEPPEGIELQIDDAGESWVGQGRPVADPSKTTARVSFTIRGEEPYWIDLALDAKPADPHKPQ